ncbi:hypothetical protein BOTCAL_0294g00100 [Botryotinia calthae]|uniref:Rhodopsin domain-containing protein n=1 Tax=Botryotinia calthae TaxID=38488 RepID=A0A4Y8CUQ0_9HELO|nr:hypothetical protein BOTCAL_0294g00100 [Botryotinia calthae]
MDPVNLPSNDDRASTLYAIIYTPLICTIPFLALRIWIRTKMKSLGVDDYLMVGCMLVFIGAIVVTTIYAVKGGCRHIFYLTPSQIVEIVKLNFVAQAFGITSPTLGKLSVGFLMQRILGPHTVYRKWFIHIVMAVYGLWTALTVIFTYTQCTPTSALWNPTPDMKCWGNQVFPDIAVSHGAFGTFIDFSFALLPITLVKQLAVTPKQKLALSILLSMGILAGIAAAIKTNQLKEFGNQTDPTWATFDIFVWTTVEIHLVIICGCLPTLRPIYERIINKRAISPSKSSSKPTHGSSTQASATNKGSFWKNSKASTTITSDSRWINLTDRSEDKINVERSVEIDSQSARSES